MLVVIGQLQPASPGPLRPERRITAEERLEVAQTDGVLQVLHIGKPQATHLDASAPFASIHFGGAPLTL